MTEAAPVRRPMTEAIVVRRLKKFSFVFLKSMTAGVGSHGPVPWAAPQTRGAVRGLIAGR
jgi:hypothetical protein